MSRAAERPPVYPKTDVRDVAETKFGTTVRDRYRWLRVETRVGHGMGKPLAKLIEEVADL